MDERLSLFPGPALLWRDVRRRPQCDLLLYGEGRDFAALAQLAGLQGLRTFWFVPNDFPHEQDFMLGGLSLAEHAARAKLPLCCPGRLITLQPVNVTRSFLGFTLLSAKRQASLVRTLPLLFERVAAARQEGAIVLNHVAAELIGRTKSGATRVRVTHEGTTLDVEASLIVCGRAPTACFVYSALFAAPCSAPSVQSRGGVEVQWVPHPCGSAVSASGRFAVSELSQIVLGFAVSRDLGSPVWNSPLSADAADLGPDTLWMPSYDPLRAELNASAVFKRFSKRIAHALTPASLEGRALPGDDLGLAEPFVKAAQEAGVPQLMIDGAISRFGSLVRWLAPEPADLEVIGGKYLRGEVTLAMDLLQARNAEEVAVRLWSAGVPPA